MLTNLLALPAPLLEAVRNDPYTRDGVDFTATELIAPAYLKTLQRNHADEVDVDASDRIWSLLGQSVHGILERSTVPGYIMERRYVGEFFMGDHLKIRVGAKIDVYNTIDGVLDDYKVTSVYKFKTGLNGFREVPEEYTAQLNIQAECIYRETGYEIKKARIVGILRDWRRSEASREAGYPRHQIDTMEVPIWPHAQREAYIIERIRLHMEPSPPVCTPRERWERPNRYALMKVGQKRAVKLYDTADEASHALGAMGGKSAGYYTDDRPGARTRCDSYCDVASKCADYQAFLAAEKSTG